MIPKELKGSKKKNRKRLYLKRQTKRQHPLDELKKLTEKIGLRGMAGRGGGIVAGRGIF